MAVVRYGETNRETGGQAFVDVLELALYDHPAWTKMAVVYGLHSSPCSVWKCSGTQNHLGRDFYLMIARTLSDSDTGPSVTGVHIGVAEGYDPYEQEMIRPAPAEAGVKVNRPANDASYGGGIGFPLWKIIQVPGPIVDGEVTWEDAPKLNDTDFRWSSMTYGSIPRSFWVVITEDTVAWFVKGMTDYSNMAWGIAGVGEPFRPDDYGIVAILGSGALTGAVTRHPNVVVANKANFQLALVGIGIWWTPMVGQIGGEGDRLHDSRPIGTRFLLRHTGQPGVTGTLRGLMRNMLCIDTKTNSAVTGDYVFVGDDRYIWPGVTGQRVWFNTTPR